MPNYFFDHIHLLSQDPLKTAEFYEKMFGAAQIGKRDRGNGLVTINLNLNGTTILVSNPASDNAQTGLDHYGIRTDNLEEAVDELKAKGVKFTREIKEMRPGFKVSFFTGPENVSVELLQEGSI
ncbi:VOC family protein [Chloroflexota bacterium]